MQTNARRWRAAILGFAATSLALQLFVTQIHAFMGELGWIGWPAAQGASAAPAMPSMAMAGHGHHHHARMSTGHVAMAMAQMLAGAAAAGADQADHAQGKQPECPIFQSLHILAASIATPAFELAPPPQEGDAASAAVADAADAIATCPRPQPRAPPLSA